MLLSLGSLCVQLSRQCCHASLEAICLRITQLLMLLSAEVLCHHLNIQPLYPLASTEGCADYVLLGQLPCSILTIIDNW